MSYIERLKRWEPSPDAAVAMMFGVGVLWVALMLYLLALPPWVLWLVGAIVVMCAWTWVEERWPWVLRIVSVVGISSGSVVMYSHRDWDGLCVTALLGVCAVVDIAAHAVRESRRREREEREDRRVERIAREVSRTIRE